MRSPASVEAFLGELKPWLARHFQSSRVTFEPDPMGSGSVLRATGAVASFLSGEGLRTTTRLPGRGTPPYEALYGILRRHGWRYEALGEGRFAFLPLEHRPTRPLSSLPTSRAPRPSLFERDTLPSDEGRSTTHFGRDTFGLDTLSLEDDERPTTRFGRDTFPEDDERPTTRFGRDTFPEDGRPTLPSLRVRLLGFVRRASQG